MLVAAKVKGDDGEDRRILARSKSNIGPDEGGFEYHLLQSEPVPGIYASYVAWGVSVVDTARELLTDPNEESSEAESAQDAAADSLRQVLGDDVVPSKSIEAEAKEAGIAWRTVRRASDELSVKKQRGEGGKWYWSLPKLSNLSKVSNVENMDKLDKLTLPDNADADESTASSNTLEQVEMSNASECNEVLPWA